MLAAFAGVQHLRAAVRRPSPSKAACSCFVRVGGQLSLPKLVRIAKVPLRADRCALCPGPEPTMLVTYLRPLRKAAQHLYAWVRRERAAGARADLLLCTGIGGKYVTPGGRSATVEHVFTLTSRCTQFVLLISTLAIPCSRACELLVRSHSRDPPMRTAAGAKTVPNPLHKSRAAPL